ncbi:MAG TPA: phenylalanine--tRNA ligase subunit alpha, partial [Acidimicrobiia bacterium]|nr:phenylalanine--tRNA ligase subunit alpha [Acidimicrobiia bacterium]
MTAATDLVVRAEAVAREGSDAFAHAGSLDDLAEAERRFLGKSSALNEIREAIKSVDGSERAVVGKAVSGARAELEAAHAQRLEVLGAQAAALSATRDRLDLTLGGHEYVRGHMHPVTRIWRELEDVFVGLGYKVAEGPEVETDW